MATLVPYLLVGLGGFLGANARFILAHLVDGAIVTRFPLATFLINVSGSFLLGLLGAAVAVWVGPGSYTARVALGVGFLGAFTTFSTFELETHALLENGAWPMAVAYTMGSVLAGLLALRAGVVLGRAWLGTA